MMQACDDEELSFKLPFRPENPIARTLDSPRLYVEPDEDCFLPSLSPVKDQYSDIPSFSYDLELSQKDRASPPVSSANQVKFTLNPEIAARVPSPDGLYLRDVVLTPFRPHQFSKGAVQQHNYLAVTSSLLPCSSPPSTPRTPPSVGKQHRFEARPNILDEPNSNRFSPTSIFDSNSYSKAFAPIECAPVTPKTTVLASPRPQRTSKFGNTSIATDSPLTVKDTTVPSQKGPNTLRTPLPRKLKWRGCIIPPGYYQKTVTLTGTPTENLLQPEQWKHHGGFVTTPLGCGNRRLNQTPISPFRPSNPAAEMTLFETPHHEQEQTLRQETNQGVGSPSPACNYPKRLDLDGCSNDGEIQEGTVAETRLPGHPATAVVHQSEDSFEDIDLSQP